MKKTIQKRRAVAFKQQQGRCHYCTTIMWLETPSELAEFGVPAKRAQKLQCTAEHLVARQDGGNDAAQNIVAACLTCNLRRHRYHKSAPSSENYLTAVRSAVRRGDWHKKWVYMAQLLAPQALSKSLTSKL